MFVELRKPAAFGKDVHGRLCFRNRSEETSKDVFDCSVVFPARMGGGFATVKEVGEHKGVADSSLEFRMQPATDQPIASADNDAHKSAIWRMADKGNRLAQRVGKDHTHSQPVQQSSTGP